MRVKETLAQAAERTKPKVSSRESAARQLDVCVRTVDRMIASGALASVQIGRRRLIPNAAIDALLRGRP